MSESMKVLIGVDGSCDGDEAFNFYANHLRFPQHEVMIVYVVRPLVISSNEMATRINGIRDRSMSEVKFKVKCLKENYENKMRILGIRGKINIIYYSKKPGKIICDLAQEEHCSIIVVGCMRNGNGSLGPTVDYVLRKASCNVSIVRLPETSAALFDSHSRYQFPGRQLSSDGETRFRRISCPVVRSQCLGSELEASGGASGYCAPVAGSEYAAGKKEPKQRRHSAVVNAFQYLTLQSSGKKKRIPSHEEVDETNA